MEKKQTNGNTIPKNGQFFLIGNQSLEEKTGKWNNDSKEGPLKSIVAYENDKFDGE